MVRYRRLSSNELRLLEQPFIRFLAAQSIPAGDWERIRDNESERYNELVDLFSDTVMEKTLHNVKILEQRNDRRIVFYRFSAEEAELIGLEFDEVPGFDLAGEFRLEELIEYLGKKEVRYSLIHGKKQYSTDRSKEIFAIMQQGAVIPVSDDLFNLMLNIHKNIS